eukprot:1136723-Pelagomonas_calceolata.AAC.4
MQNDTVPSSMYDGPVRSSMQNDLAPSSMQNHTVPSSMYDGPVPSSMQNDTVPSSKLDSGSLYPVEPLPTLPC